MNRSPRTFDILELRKRLTYDPQTGVFRWRRRRGPRAAGAVAGHTCQRQGYVVITLDGRHHPAGRIAWAISHGAWPTGEIDHKNGNKSDNRLANLRDVTKSLNMANVGRRKTNTSGFKGVSWSRWAGRWEARIQIAGKQKFLGYFGTPELAHAAYCAAAVEAFGECARAA